MVATGEAAARAVIGRMMRNRIRAKRLEEGQLARGHGGGGGGGGGGSRAKRAERNKEGGGNVAAAGRGGWGAGDSSGEGGVFKTVLSSLAKERLREGLKEIKSNPSDVLRCGFVEIEPARHGSTALGCHLMKGWTEQRAGNKRRVRASLAETHNG